MENMNILLVAVICFIVLCVALGFLRGFVKNLAVLASTILTMILVMSILNPALAFVEEHTDFEGDIADKCYQKIESLLPAEAVQAIDAANMLAEEQDTSEMTEDELAQYQEAIAAAQSVSGYDMTTNEQSTIIESVDLPQILKDKLTENNNDEVYAELGVDNFVDYVCAYVARVFMKMIVFVLLFALITVFLRIIILSMEKLSFEMPLLRGINAIAGGFMGVGVAIAMIWVFFVVMTLCCTRPWGQNCFAYMEQSHFLTMLYEQDKLISMLARLG